ncbi:hypothetical protein BpHYR1_024288 [Brachionus plicatilis]|uniref:PDZ domain-containing protein n=1 Tax=Brachionus plicatilis TaxID=10195 RepID=A0A3M7P1F1_BRAPC|nr:hypothetical protein BpHYR1_024288 [Brachionus plicatilis]
MVSMGLKTYTELSLKFFNSQITIQILTDVKIQNIFKKKILNDCLNIKSVPIGYSLITIYLSSLETKCIMPSDLKESADADGLYKMQKSTLQIGEQDNLKKGDIIYCINGENMAYCNKFDLVSKLSNLNGIAEVSILRKSNCYGPHKDQVPYHNGIFAQNSIKLAMPKYDKPSIKSNSENDMHNNGINSSKTDIFSDEFRHSMYNIRSEMDNNDSQVFKATLVQCKDLEAELNTIQPESIANDNWLLYDKNSTEKILKSSTIDSRKFEKTENSVTQTFKDTDTANPVTHLSEPSLLFDHGTARSLTSSSCHSERSMIQLNAVCIENDLVSKDDESESEVNAKSAKESDSFPDYSVIAPKNEPTQSDSNKYVSICQIEIKSSNTAQNKLANLKIVKPCRVTFDPDLSDCETVREKTEPIVHPKSTDLETLIEDNFPVEIKDMTENDCDLNSPRITSHSSDYCKLSTKGFNDTYHDNYEKFDQYFDNDAVKLVLDRIIEQIELMNEEKDETLSDMSSFGLRETFEEFDECKDIHPDETSDTILEEADLKDTNNCESVFECEEPRPEVINEHKTEELKDESTLSRLLKSDSDSSSSLLKHSTQIGLDDTQACLNTSIPPAPPLPEKMFSSISDVSAIQASYDICRTFEATQSLEESNLHLRESSLPNMSLENDYDKVRSPIKKMSKVSDRINSLITARPYSSLKSPITKQDKANNYCKALLAFKKQNSTFSKFFIVQTRALFNDQMVCNRSTSSFSRSASPKQEKKYNQTWNNFIGGAAQKNINLKSDKNRKVNY